MEYIDVHETAKKWNIPERRVTLLCRERRIVGAYKSGNNWYIPSDAERPMDGRTREYAAAVNQKCKKESVSMTTIQYTEIGASRNAVSKFKV